MNETSRSHSLQNAIALSSKCVSNDKNVQIYTYDTKYFKDTVFKVNKIGK